jgi:hypothetical protein
MSTVWYCNECTFRHSFHGTRCSMCNSLRVTTQEMRDFIAGKQIGGDSSTADGSASNSSAATRNPATSTGGAGAGGVSGKASINDKALHSFAAGSENPNSIGRNQRIDTHSNAQKAVLPRQPNSTSTAAASKAKRKTNQPLINPYVKNPYAINNAKHVSNSNNIAHQAIGRQGNTQQKNVNTSERNAYTSIPPKKTLNPQQNKAILHNGSATTNRRMYQNTNTNGNRQNTNQNANTTISSSTKIHNPYAKKPTPAQNPVATGISSNTKTPLDGNNSRQNMANWNNGAEKINKTPHSTNKIPQQRNVNRPTFQSAGRNEAVPHSTDEVASNTSNSSGRIPSSSKSQQPRHIGATPTATTQPTAARKQQQLGFQNRSSASASNVVERNTVNRGYQPGPVPLVQGEALKTWIYPKSDKFVEREYQLAISRSAIMQNTLVSLPTGLGKTLIAAVVMYNFYRWFPTGLIIFCAPTRPLVRQQIEACYNIMGIPEVDTAEISGNVKPKDRKRLWRTRRLFFCTPQTVQIDIENKNCEIDKVVCLVLDEAHKATGKYAYTQVVQQLTSSGARARVVS